VPSIDVDIRVLEPRDVPAAALVAARGMRDNPLHLAAIGDDPQRRVKVMQRIFTRMFPLSGRVALVAWQDQRLVGVAGSAVPGRCQPSGLDRLKLAPAMLAAGSALPRMGKWVGAWAKRDPEQVHSHFGPFSVDLDVQGRGIGSQLLGRYCRDLDEIGAVSYLETDKRENVRLYERFGFVVTDQADVIGVPNWFMQREARRG
jgi:GNAT superfamily N-acetyltransferase